MAERLKTLSPGNLACIECPNFKVEVELRGCLFLHQQHMVGKRLEKRRGCQALMASSKCPVWHILQEIRRGEDPYHSAERKKVRLSDHVLKRIAPITPQQVHLDRYSVPQAEVDRILASHSEMLKGLHLADGEARPKRKAKLLEPEATPTDLSAAEKGDMAAAVNAAMKGQAA